MTDRRTRWYIREAIGGQPRQLWLFTDQTATRWGVTNPENGPGTYFKAHAGETSWQCIDRLTGWLKPEVTEGQFREMVLGPAEFYPRMARPLVLASQPLLWSPPLEKEKAYIAGARGQLTLLVRRLELICQTVQPSASTLQVYGHEIRNLLILASTEAEMHWRGILKANSSQITKPNSNQFVKLVDPLKLGDYTVGFRDYPDMPPIAPFVGWIASDPTESLQWYAAYNGAKHNREEEFKRGTLEHAFAAVAACLSLLVAQFGPIALGAELSGYVSVGAPAWPVAEMYISRVTESDWRPVAYPGLA